MAAPLVSLPTAIYDTPLFLRVGVDSTPPGPLENASDAVTLLLSDNTVVNIGTKADCLKLMKHMRENKQWLLQLSDDVMAVSVSHVKLLFLESNLINQKLITSFLPTYIGPQTTFAHRSLSQLLYLEGALESVGFANLQDTVFSDNETLQLGRTYMKIVDWNFRAQLTDAQRGSILNDLHQIVYDF